MLGAHLLAYMATRISLARYIMDREISSDEWKHAPVGSYCLSEFDVRATMARDWVMPCNIAATGT